MHGDSPDLNNNSVRSTLCDTRLRSFDSVSKGRIDIIRSTRHDTGVQLSGEVFPHHRQALSHQLCTENTGSVLALANSDNTLLLELGSTPSEHNLRFDSAVDRALTRLAFIGSSAQLLNILVSNFIKRISKEANFPPSIGSLPFVILPNGIPE
ncbi:hypothetical protein J6590_001972 [Homalodisca vitripennis]|nr:hypothetical protein J6590_001972 [Homalodisca vitripennis]